MTGGARILAVAGLLAMAGPAAAQRLPRIDCPPQVPGCDRLPQLLDELGRQIGPLLDDLAGRADPWLGELHRLLGDLTRWEAPVILPNGDILIRRRPSAPPHRPPGRDQDPEPPVSEPLEL